MWWVVGAVIVAAVVVGVLVQRSRSATEQATVTRPASAVGPNGGVLVGDKNAPVTITEFGDFQCPVCGQLHQLWEPTLEQLIQQGKVKFEFVGLAVPRPGHDRVAALGSRRGVRGGRGEVHRLLQRAVQPAVARRRTPDSSRTTSYSASLAKSGSRIRRSRVV